MDKLNIILGANGFLGSKISEHLEYYHYPVKRLDKNQLNFLNENTFPITDFSNSLIFDCIAKIDGTKEEIELTNNSGFEQFLKFLKKHHRNFKYIYFSTLSATKPLLVESNNYIRSKSNAESILKAQRIDYKIIRLTFPFGKRESPNRLFSRIIYKLKANEELALDDIKINITPVDSLLEWLPALIESDDEEINFTDGQVYKLFDVVSYLRKEIGSSSSINLRQNKLDITFDAYKEGLDFRSAVFDTLYKMIHEN